MLMDQNAQQKCRNYQNWFSKCKILQYLPYKRQFKYDDTHRLKINGWKRTYNTNSKHRKTGVALLIADKISFKAKSISNVNMDIL